MLDIVQAFVSGFFQVFTFSTFTLMIIGIAVGFWVGILPGLGGPTALALMLPFIFKMTPVEASGYVAAVREYALKLFPGKEVVFDLVYAPRLRRVLIDKFQMN